MADPIIFRGIKFPFKKGRTFPERATDKEVIRDSLVQLILTSTTERVMRPDFGSNALSFVFENNDDVLAGLIRSEVQGVIAKFEPRIQTRNINVKRRDSSVIITVEYVILSSREVDRVGMEVPAG